MQSGAPRAPARAGAPPSRAGAPPRRPARPPRGPPAAPPDLPRRRQAPAGRAEGRGLPRSLLPSPPEMPGEHRRACPRRPGEKGRRRARSRRASEGRPGGPRATQPRAPPAHIPAAWGSQALFSFSVNAGRATAFGASATFRPCPARAPGREEASGDPAKRAVWRPDSPAALKRAPAPLCGGLGAAPLRPAGCPQPGLSWGAPSLRECAPPSFPGPGALLRRVPTASWRGVFPPVCRLSGRDDLCHPECQPGQGPETPEGTGGGLADTVLRPPCQVKVGIVTCTFSRDSAVLPGPCRFPGLT